MLSLSKHFPLKATKLTWIWHNPLHLCVIVYHLYSSPHVPLFYSNLRDYLQ